MFQRTGFSINEGPGICGKHEHFGNNKENKYKDKYRYPNCSLGSQNWGSETWSPTLSQTKFNLLTNKVLTVINGGGGVYDRRIADNRGKEIRPGIVGTLYRNRMDT